MEILCLELGKEKKYTGVTKEKLIANLLKVVSQKRTGAFVGFPSTDHEDDEHHHHPPASSSKRQRKMSNPSRIPVVGSSGRVCYCRNAACKAAILDSERGFCRRCTCCICYTYDDNKDPSLWLVCSEDDENSNHNNSSNDDNSNNSSSSSCGATCHLECVFHRAKSSTSPDHGDGDRLLDGCFKCVSCGKLNDLLRCLRKQLFIAKQARRVDVLCHRIFLIHRLLAGTQKYDDVNQIVDGIVNKLEIEVGPLNGLSKTMTRGIVNRLPSVTQIQKLCTLAIDCIDSHKKSGTTNVGAAEAACGDLNMLPDDNGSENEETQSVLPATPSKLEWLNTRTKPIVKPVKQLTEEGSLTRSSCGGEQVFVDTSVLEKDYEYHVKVIRWLESNGHIQTKFRMKFLTWFSLRATQSERKVVSVFVDTLIEDPPSLAGQLVDTFAEGISTKKTMF